MSTIEVTRLAFSTIGSYQLRATSSYLLSSWTIPAYGFHWEAALVDVIRPAERVRALDASVGDFGTTFDIVWFRFTPAMLTQLWSDFGSKLYTDITIEVYHEFRGLEVYNGRAQWPDLQGGATQAHPNFFNIVMPIQQASIAPYGRSFSASFSASFG